MKRFLAGWLSLVLLVVGVLLVVRGQADMPPSHVVQLAGSPHPLIARLYEPAQAQKPVPAVLLFHGVSSTKETMGPLAIELAHRGIAALSVDLGGFGESYPRPYSDDLNVADGKVALAFLRQHPDRFDLKRLGAAGHSMGAITALMLGEEDSQIRATVVWGMRGLASPISPANLLLGIGLYEEFHPLPEVQAMLREASGRSLPPFQQTGDFKAGTARMLVVSPYTDHLGEPFDPLLVQTTADWMQQSFGLAVQTSPLIFPGYGLGWMLVWFGSWGLGLALWQSQPNWRSQWNRWVLRGTIVLLLSLLLRLAVAPPLASHLILWLLGLLIIANYALKTADPGRSLRAVILYGSTALVAYTLVLLGSHLGDLAQQPFALLGLPQFLLQTLPSLLYSRYSQLRSILFSSYSLTLQGSPLLFIILAIEIVAPGRILRAIAVGLGQFIPWIRQPLQWNWQPIDRRSLILLASSLLLLGGILLQRWQSGLISQDSVTVAVRVVFQMILLPALVMGLGIRTKRFQTLEQKWLEGGTGAGGTSASR